jgi:hypothetical protein
VFLEVKMANFEISNYLRDFDKKTRMGICKTCAAPVKWQRDRVASHKRGKCDQVSGEERIFFSKRKHAESLNISGDDSNDASFSETTHEATKEEIDAALANAGIKAGIPFRFFDSPAFRYFVKLLNPEYAKVMPCSKTIGGSLLNNQYEKITVKINEILQESENLTMTSDGWTNLRGDHIVNFVVKAPNRPPFFYKAIDTTGIPQTAPAVAEEIIKIIEEIGSEKFCSVVTDNASYMQAAWKIIEQRFPHISASGCAAHGANLLIKDITELPHHSKTIKDSAKVIQFINNHHIAHAKFEEKRKEAGVSHKLSTSVPTRWYTSYTSAKNLFDSKRLLQRLEREDYEELSNINPKPKSKKILSLIKNDGFWDQLESLVKDIEFPSKVIGK